jgi:hypothetical protein
MSELGTCLSCGARFLWARTPTGKRMPVELVRRPAGDVTGNVAAYRTGAGGVFARVLKDGEVPDGNEWRTVAHMAVCPAAWQHRQARKGFVRDVIPFPTAIARRARANPVLWGTEP